MSLNKSRSVLFQRERKKNKTSKSLLFCFSFYDHLFSASGFLYLEELSIRGLLGWLWRISFITVESQFGAGSSGSDEAVLSEMSLRLMCLCVLHCVQSFW